MRHPAARPVFLSFILVAALAAFASLSSAAPALQPFTPDDLLRLKRVSDPQVSPDGRQVAFVLRETDMEANRGRTHLWLLDLGAKGATPRQLTRDPAGESNPRWAPDGRSLCTSCRRAPDRRRCGASRSTAARRSR